MANPARNNLTIKKLASLCGVSVGTVSAVINNRDTVKVETAERIRKIMGEHGYQANPWAKKMQQSSTRMLALVAPYENTLYHEASIRLLTRRFRELDYTCMIQYLSRDEVLEPSSYPVDGYILLFSDYPELSQVLSEANASFLYFDPPPGVALTGPVLVMDREEGGRIAARRLIQAGHTRFAYLGGADQKYEGFAAELADQGLQSPSLYPGPDDLPSAPDESIGFFAGGLRMAFEIAVACQRLGWQFGRDHSLIFWGNAADEFESINSFAAVGMPSSSLCKQMLDLLASPDAEQSRLVLPILEERESIIGSS